LSKDAQDLRRKTHETIQKVSDDIERRHAFNTATFQGSLLQGAIHVSRNGLHLQHLHQTILKIDLVEQRKLLRLMLLTCLKMLKIYVVKHTKLFKK
jgi:leucyl-tRNA synthetase